MSLSRLSLPPPRSCAAAGAPGLRRVLQDHGRQGPARGDAGEGQARTELGLERSQSLCPRGLHANGRGQPRQLSRQHVEEAAHRAHLSRLPAQRPYVDRGRAAVTTGRPGAPVSMPVYWTRCATALIPCASRSAPSPALLAKSKAWSDYCDSERPLEAAIRKLVAASDDGAAGKSASENWPRSAFRSVSPPMEARLVRSCRRTRAGSSSPSGTAFAALPFAPATRWRSRPSPASRCRASFRRCWRNLTRAAPRAIRARWRAGHSRRWRALVRCAADAPASRRKPHQAAGAGNAGDLRRV